MTSWLQKLGWKRVNFGTLLDSQLTLASSALKALELWCQEPGQLLVDRIFEIEKEADEARRAVAVATTIAFETPLDREDLSDLSRRIDDLVDAIRALVRLGAALKVKPDSHITTMVTNLYAGMQPLHVAVLALPKELEVAFLNAREARRPLRLNERVYAIGVSELYEGEDHRTVFRQMELFHAVMGLSEAQERIADLLDHAINKLA